MLIPQFLASRRAAIMAVFAAFGTAMGALAGSIPTVTRAAGVNSFELGLAIAGSTFCTVITMSCGGIIAHYLSNRIILLWGLPVFAALLTAVLTSTSAPVFYSAFLGLGLIIGLTDVFMNAEGAAIEIDLAKPVFSKFHASFSTGMPALAILSSFLSNKFGPWSAALVVTFCLAIAWWMVYRLVPARKLAAGREARITSLPRKLPLVLLGTAVGLIIAAEVTAVLWSAKLLDEQAPGLAAIAGLGTAFYGLCNASFRFHGDRLRSRFGDLPLMTASLALAIAGFAALGLSQSFSASVAAFAVVGLGTAVLVPCAFALAAQLVPGNRAAGIGFISMVAGIPRVAAPWLFGWIVTVTSMSSAFGLFAGVLTAALVLVVVLRNLQRSTPIGAQGVK